MATTHQYARALERAGRLDEAQRLYEWAAADGYAPATAALERLAGTAEATGALALPADAAETAEMLAGLATVLGRYQASLPPDPADPLTVLAEVGGDPKALESAYRALSLEPRPGGPGDAEWVFEVQSHREPEQ